MPLPACERLRLCLTSLSRATAAGAPLMPDDASATRAVDSAVSLLRESDAASIVTLVFLSRDATSIMPLHLPLSRNTVASSSTPPSPRSKCSKRAKEEKVNTMD
ncbi:hypothetical protein E2562_016158 [Oryza meyeriana var. granulata]|uniref:Uncharacterized protein n=1 Tax=Oryza meyeriana var. granulata TaxID=110450 RepID=A0A6G1F8N0_9ORYZ|nr:hypothetical protein E2562_016158 [Oryza meyeriana var. granulata]